MGKLLKFELRRNRTAYLIMFGLLAGLEGIYVTGRLLEKIEMTAFSMILLMFFGGCSVLFVMINGAHLYAQDLKNKTGYMVFMVPMSGYKILGAKLLAVFLGSLALMTGFTAVITANTLCYAKIQQLDIFNSVVLSLTGREDMTFWNIGVWVLMEILAAYSGMFCIILYSYLAESVSATVLENKKLRNLAATVLFLVLLFGVSYVKSRLFGKADTMEIGETIRSMIPPILTNFGISAAAFWGSAYLLEHKMSL